MMLTQSIATRNARRLARCSGQRSIYPSFSRVCTVRHRADQVVCGTRCPLHQAFLLLKDVIITMGSCADQAHGTVLMLSAVCQEIALLNLGINKMKWAVYKHIISLKSTNPRNLHRHSSNYDNVYNLYFSSYFHNSLLFISRQNSTVELTVENKE